MKIIEIKVINGFYFKLIKEGKADIYWGKQLSYYADQIAKQYDTTVSAYSLIVDRNIGTTMLIPLKYETYTEDIELIKYCIEDNVLPGKCNNEMCQKCELKTVCRTTAAETLDAFIDDVVSGGFVY